MYRYTNNNNIRSKQIFTYFNFKSFLIGGQQSNSARGSDLNKSKGGDKKQTQSSTDDTDQPGIYII